jgi:hypothetical protein
VLSRSNKAVVIAVAVIALLIVSGAIGWYLTLKGGTLRPDLPSTITGGGVRPEPAPRPAAPAIPGSEFWINFSSMLWPLVTVVAIVALFFIARQAISSGSNVTIVWKVTEKMQGRVVITKVREQASRRRAVA